MLSADRLGNENEIFSTSCTSSEQGNAHEGITSDHISKEEAIMTVDESMFGFAGLTPMEQSTSVVANPSHEWPTRSSLALGLDSLPDHALPRGEIIDLPLQLDASPVGPQSMAVETAELLAASLEDPRQWSNECTPRSPLTASTSTWHESPHAQAMLPHPTDFTASKESSARQASRAPPYPPPMVALPPTALAYINFPECEELFFEEVLAQKK